MTNQQIERLIQDAEKEVGSTYFIGARWMGLFSTLLTPFMFLGELGVVIGVLLAACSFVTVALWSDAKAMKRKIKQAGALPIWRQIGRTDVFGANPPAKTRELLKQIAHVYEHDAQGQVLPLSQAVRLALVWQQQQKRFQLVDDHMRQMTVLRHRLLDKQKLLRELNDDNSQIEKALAQLNADITALERSHDSLRASCVRLESLISTVDAAARRRQLHREVGELAAHLPLGDESALQVRDEHLDLERQIGREIETFLELERETDAHLREV